MRGHPHGANNTFDDNDDTEIQASLVNMALCALFGGCAFIYFTAGTIFYLVSLTNYSFAQLSQQSQLLVGTYIMGCYFTLFPLLVTLRGISNFSDGLLMFYPFTIVIFLGGSLQLRLFHMYIKITRSRMIASETSFQLVSPRERELQRFFDETLNTSLSANIDIRRPQNQQAVQKTLPRLSRKFKRLTFMSSDRFFVTLYLGRILLVLGLYFGARYKYQSVSDEFRYSDYTHVVWLFLGPWVALHFCLAVAFYYSVRKEPDPFRTRSDVGWGMLAILPGSVSSSFLQTVDPYGLLAKNKITWWIFLTPWVCISFYFVILRPIFRAKRIRQAGEDDEHSDTDEIYQDEFPDVHSLLGNETAKELFKLHLTDEYCFENFQFYETIAYWKESFSRMTPKQKERFCKGVSTIYLDPAAELPLNISWAMKQGLIMQIQAKEYSETMFDGVLFEVERLMSTDSFYRFKTSNRYKKWKNGRLDMNDLDDSYIAQL